MRTRARAECKAMLVALGVTPAALPSPTAKGTPPFRTCCPPGTRLLRRAGCCDAGCCAQDGEQVSPSAVVGTRSALLRPRTRLIRR